MNLPPITRVAVCAALVALCAAGVGFISTRPASGQESESGVLRGAAALDHLKQDGQYDSLQAAMNQARFGVSHAEAPPLGRAAWRAPNPAAGYDAYVTETGVSIAINDKSHVSLSLIGIGYGEPLQFVAPGEVIGDKQSITINRHHGLSEWFVNGPDGLEHGFTLSEPPQSAIRNPQSAIPLRLALEVSKGWRGVASDDGKLVTLRGPNDEAVEYGKLVARDKLGRNIPARLAVADKQVVIEVEDSGAEYPLTIDPLFTLQQRLTAGDGAAQDFFGFSVALDGDTALIGAYGDDTFRGSVYVFARSGATWSFQQKLTAPDGAAYDEFGSAVALDGDTALIGASNGPNGANLDQGAAYVFTRNGASWTLQQKLNANSGLREMDFGSAVALDGDTALIGAQSFSTNALFIPGAAYVFTRSGSGWTQQAQLFASDIGNRDRFGAAVALEDDTAIIGAPGNAVTQLGQGSAYVFTRNGATWKEQKILTANDAAANDNFGNAVALSGDTVALGANKYGGDDRGKVYTFKRGATGWAQTDSAEAPNPLAGAYFGASVALDGDRMIVGAAPALYGNARAERSAYAFVRNGGWRPVRQFGTEVGSAYDLFGYAVALDGSTVLVGAPRGDAAATDQGAAYVFALRDSQHSEQQKLTASDGKENDQFGAVVVLDGDTLAVGAPLWDAGGRQDVGAVYLFTRNGAVWSFQQQLTGARDNDRFGQAVALNGDTLAVGAPRADHSAGADQGAVLIYARNGATWAFRQLILAGDAAPYDYFGAAVALDGNTMLVGAPFDDIEERRDRGSAYVFIHNGAIWTPQTQLLAQGGGADDWFGSAVALDGDTAAVGAPRDEMSGDRPDEGTVWMFTRSGATWTRRQFLNGADTSSRDYFGSVLALRGDTLMVGVPDHGFTPPPSPYAGAVYAFSRDATGWTQRQKITANDKAEYALFGASIALDGDRLVVGAPGTNNGANAIVGAAYVFTGSDGTQPVWTQQQKLTASAGSTIQYFGGGVALSDETVAVGAPYDAVGGTLNQGSVYVFASPVCQDVTITPTALPNAALNAAYRQTLAASGSGAGAYLFSVSGGALPPGLSLDQAGLLTGTPTATGAYRFTISATRSDTLCAGNRDYTLTVTPPCPALTLAPATLPNGKRSAPFNQTLTTSGGAAPYNYVLTEGALPPGLSLSASGVLSGDPSAANTYNFTIVATDANGCTATRAYALTINTNAVATVSAASFKPGGAPESIAATFGVDLAAQTEVAAGAPLPTELGGVRVTIRDSQGVDRLAPLFFVSPGQINFQVPQYTATGAATINVSSGATGQLEITRVAPGLFTANADGQGAPSAVFLRVRADGSQSFEPVARFDGSRFVPLPVDLGPFGDQVFLVVFGTGFRRRQQVSASIGGVPTNVLFAGAVAGYVGLDQANVLVPRTMKGYGEASLAFSVDGVAANYVRINVR